MQNTPIPKYDPVLDAPWPSPYPALTDPCPEPAPRVRRHAILDFAPTVTSWFLDDNKWFARRYFLLVLEFAHQAKSGANKDLSGDYVALMREQADAPQWLEFANAHDFANIHRTAWLRLFEAITCILNFNIHQDWGDPPAGGSSQGRYKEPPMSIEHFHTTPNGYGSYAIGTLDLGVPDLGIGESRTSTPKRMSGKELPVEQIKLIARRVGRALVDPKHGGDYLEVVKRYYRDGLSHTLEYIDVIRGMPDDPSSGVTIPPSMTDNDVANVHRGTWLFLAHRFSYLVGKNPFGDYGDTHDKPTHSVVLPIPDDVQLRVGGRRRSSIRPYVAGPRVFEFPNEYGDFYVNLKHIDPDDDF